ncbi:hypothetical protein [Deinococcus sp. Marseille-Q6407]|uniref:hypothetical protein n=1 Tax=Deinococcus sp. Marseille-Q6407 TaxID=2969223 RepID=UPI0021C0F453|nr:hypothetical protein [Deinococcus sp. Marseille-Q6407]
MKNDRSQEVPPLNLKVGDTVHCNLDNVDAEIIRFTNGTVPWPMGRAKGSTRRGPASILVFGSLEKALREWAGPEVEETFGISRAQVTKLRRALNIFGETKGTAAYRRRLLKEGKNPAFRPPVQWTEEQDEMILSPDYSRKELSERFGVHPSTLYRRQQYLLNQLAQPADH